MASYRFRANDCFDPDQSGTGHQPYGFDQYFPAMYNHGIVLGSKIYTSWTLGYPQSINAANSIICGITLQDDPALPTDQELLREKGGYTKWMQISNEATPKKLHFSFSTRRFFNVKDVKDNAQLAFRYNESPAEQAYYHLWCAPPASNVDAFNVLVQVVIDYIVVCQEPNSFFKS